MRTLVTDPLIPGNLWAALALLSLGAVAAYVLFRPPRVPAARRAAIGILLAIGVAGILAVLLNPTWQETVHEELGRPVLGVLVDTSGSMETSDCEGRQRIEAARDLAVRLREDLKDAFEVRLWRFDKELRALAADETASAKADGVVTDLGGSVCAALQSQLGDEAALVVLSDGIHNVPDSLAGVARAARMARAMAVPLFTATLGKDAVVEDLGVKLPAAGEVAFVRQEVPVRVVVEHAGISRASARVTLQAEGEDAQSQVVDVLAGASAEAEFRVRRDQPGLFHYVARVEPLPGETARANNERAFYLRVIDTPIRVLVLEGKPYWDSKFLLRRLAEDAGVRVTGAVRVKDGRVILRQAAAEPGPGQERSAQETVSLLKDGASLLGSYEALKGYHVIILGRDAQVFLTAENVDNLCRWVGEWGGALVCARGRPLAMVPERLDTVMPVKWKTGREVRFRVQMTQDGEAAGWLPRDSSLMPSLATGSEVATVKPLATVVAQAGGQAGVEGMAAVSFQPYGSGRVVVIEGSGHWRWAFLPTDDAEHKDLYGRFWNGLLRWLAASAEFLPGQTAALRTAQTTFTNLDTVVLQLAVRDDPEVAPGSAPLMEVRGSGPTQRLSALPGGETPGVFLASCGPLPTGSYVASLLRRGDAHPVRCAFDVQEPVAERLDLRARQGLMRRLSEESEGAVLGDSPAAQIRKAYTDYWALRHPEQFRRTPAWDRTSVLLALAGIMGATWMVRRRGGLV